MVFKHLNKNHLPDGEACLSLGPDCLCQPDPTQKEILKFQKFGSSVAFCSIST